MKTKKKEETKFTEVTGMLHFFPDDSICLAFANEPKRYCRMISLDPTEKLLLLTSNVNKQRAKYGMAWVSMDICLTDDIYSDEYYEKSKIIVEEKVEMLKKKMNEIFKLFNNKEFNKKITKWIKQKQKLNDGMEFHEINERNNRESSGYGWDYKAIAATFKKEWQLYYTCQHHIDALTFWTPSRMNFETPTEFYYAEKRVKFCNKLFEFCETIIEYSDEFYELNNK